MFKDFQLFLIQVSNYFDLVMKADRKSGFKYHINHEEMISILSVVEDGLIKLRNHIIQTKPYDLVFKNDLYGEMLEVNA